MTFNVKAASSGKFDLPDWKIALPIDASDKIGRTVIPTSGASTGGLSYDADGSGFTAAKVFAGIENKMIFTTTDLIAI